MNSEHAPVSGDVSPAPVKPEDGDVWAVASAEPVSPEADTAVSYCSTIWH
jgi:hypothetical protein